MHFEDLEDIAKGQGVDRSYVGRMLQLTSLAPDIVESILTGQAFADISLQHCRKGIPIFWEEQRRTKINENTTIKINVRSHADAAVLPRSGLLGDAGDQIVLNHHVFTFTPDGDSSITAGAEDLVVGDDAALGSNRPYEVDSAAVGDDILADVAHYLNVIEISLGGIAPNTCREKIGSGVLGPHVDRIA